MGLVRSCICSLALLMIASAAFGVEARHEVYVIQTKPPSVVIVDAQKGEIAGKIPIEKDPNSAIVDSQGRFLYVLHEHKSLMGMGMYKSARLSIVDLAKRHVDRVIQLKIGIDRMQLSSDGGTLFCFSYGNDWRMGGHWKPKDDASITIVDTTSQKVSHVYRLNTPASNIVATSDGSRIFAFSNGLIHKHFGMDHLGEEMTVFEGTKKVPLATADLQNYLLSAVFSADQKLLFLLGESRNEKGKAVHDGATLDVVDVETGKVLHAYTVGDDPLRLVRLADEPGVWVEEKDEMQFVSADGVLGTEKIMLNGKAASGGPKLGGNPAEILSLPGDKLAVTVINKKGASEHRLAVLDVKEQKVARLVHVGKEGVRAGKRAAHIALAVGLSAASYGAASGVGSPSFIEFLPGFSLSHAAGLAKSADGKYFYALDGASNDITVVGSADGAIAGHIHVDSSSFFLWRAKGSHSLYCLSGGKVSVIDTETNKSQAEYKISGNLRDGDVDPATTQVSILTDKELDIWDGMDGKQVASVKGLDHALLIARKVGVAP